MSRNVYAPILFRSPLLILLQIHSKQIVQAHTILKSVAHKYADKPVLVLGGRNDVVRKVAEGLVLDNTPGCR